MSEKLLQKMRAFGRKSAENLAGHLLDMNAAKATIPVSMLNKNFVVTVEQVQARENKDTRTCCFVGCEKPAAFEIYSNYDMPDGTDITDSCMDHVGHLLPKNTTDSWTVFTIAKGG